MACQSVLWILRLRPSASLAVRNCRAPKSCCNRRLAVSTSQIARRQRPLHSTSGRATSNDISRLNKSDLLKTATGKIFARCVSRAEREKVWRNYNRKSCRVSAKQNLRRKSTIAINSPAIATACAAHWNRRSRGDGAGQNLPEYVAVDLTRRCCRSARSLARWTSNKFSIRWFGQFCIGK